MIPLTDEENESYIKQEVCHICKKKFIFDIDSCSKNMYAKHCRVRDHCHYTEKYRGSAQANCNLNYKESKQIPIVFHNGSAYNFHFIIKELAKEFDGQFRCLGENTEKYITFSVTINKKVTEIHKDGNDKAKIMHHKSSLVDNLSEGLHCDKCIDCTSCLDYMSVKDNQVVFRCFECKTNYRRDFNKELINRFASTYEFCNNDINKHILLLRKGIYPYEYMDNWNKFNETSFPNKEDSYSKLNMEGINDTDFRF